MENNVINEDIYRKIKMMVESATGSVWVGAQSRLFGRLTTTAVVSWVWVISGVLYDFQPKTIVLGLLFAITGLAVWQYMDLQNADRGYDIVEAKRTMQDRVFIASVSERIAADIEKEMDNG